MSEVDLSNWDLADYFTGVEVACLIAGVDPADPHNPKVKPAERLVLDAFNSFVWWVGRYQSRTEAYKSLVAKSRSGGGCFPLISRSAKDLGLVEVATGNIAWSIDTYSDTREGANYWIAHEMGDLFKETFDREDVVAWLRSTGKRSVYQFDLSASPPPPKKANPPSIDVTDAVILAVYARHKEEHGAVNRADVARELWGEPASDKERSARDKRIKRLVDRQVPKHWFPRNVTDDQT
jgi:hypothetical protein